MLMAGTLCVFWMEGLTRIHELWLGGVWKKLRAVWRSSQSWCWERSGLERALGWCVPRTVEGVVAVRLARAEVEDVFGEELEKFC